MFGVVLWCDPLDGKAVFWCEDQGDLAYYDSATASAEGEVVFEAGDMVQFDVTSQKRVRKAHNAQLVQEQGYAGLPETLRQTAAPAPQATQSAEIIPFSHGDSQGAPARARAQKA